MKNWMWLGIGVVIGLAVIFGGVFTHPVQFRGSEFSPAVNAPDFKLTDDQGNIFHLGDRKSKIVLMFFGYTRCPDVCPQTMNVMKKIRADLGTKADQVDYVFITVDPAYDTSARIKNFVSYFDLKIIGLGGSEAELEPVWIAYGVYRQTTSPSNNAPDQMESHSAGLYLVDRTGRLRLTYSEGTSAKDIEQDIQALLPAGIPELTSLF